MSNIKSPKKLIEVALPLDAINAEAAREKSIRHGHPSTLHLWWARRPLAAARAVLFAQMVNDPGGERGYKSGLSREQAAKKREELFDIIRELVKWENTNNETVLKRARAAIVESWRETCELNKGKPGFDPNQLPSFHDPFAGGGAIPLEAQRLGLESYASDLNPVAVLINKAMIEIPPKFADVQPVGPIPEGEDVPTLLSKKYEGAQGLAEDVRRYGYWMREEAKKRIGHLYPEVEITKQMANDRPDLAPYVGQKLTVIAWLWARTVKSPNPLFSHVDVPLVSNFILSKKKGKEAYVQPIIEGDSYRFEVKVGQPPKEAEKGTKMARGAKFECLLSKTPIAPDYIKTECFNGRGGQKLMAVVLDGKNSRVYISPQDTMEQLALSCKATWRPNTKLSEDRRAFWTPAYGLTTYGDLFTERQLIALNTFSDLIQQARKKVIIDAQKAGMTDDGLGLEQGGVSATAYGDTIATYLSFIIDKCTDYWSSICSWHNSRELIRNTFGRQAIPMSWDYAESNPFGYASGNWISMVDWEWKAISRIPVCSRGISTQFEAQNQNLSRIKIVSTDPPYYDNIGYADLSDFFYVWLRRNLGFIYPELFVTMSSPKRAELVATPYRHGSKENAERFFLEGMTEAMRKLAQQANSAFPITIYYAFKSSDTDSTGTGNTGWETFLEAVLCSGLYITGTWPMRTELGNRMIGNGTNALASSIVLVCRRRDESAESVSRQAFLRELRETMPEALQDMIGTGGDYSPVAPVDLAQAAIGPGMEIFSKYNGVRKADGSLMTVHEAMIEINRQITEYLNPEGAGFDAVTLFCNAWFEQNRWNIGSFGDADVLARAKGTTVENVKESGVALSEGGKVRLYTWQNYPEDYDPKKDKNRPAWESCHHLIRVLNQKGEKAAGALLARMPESAEDIRQLAYYLYTLCERNSDPDDARYYNELMSSWSEIYSASMEYTSKQPQQMNFFESGDLD